MMRLTIRQPYVLILCLAGLLLPAALQAQYIDLSGPGHSWRVMSGDNPTYAQNELDDRGWQTVQLPENLMSAEGLALRPNDVIWLRTTVRLQQSNRNIALILGKVADYERTYFNGVLIGKTVNADEVASHYNLARIYPIPSRLIRSGENVIAIRITGSFAGTRGIVQGPIELSTIQNVEDRFWRKQRTLLIFTAVYFATGIFFLILYRRLRNLNDYKWFGIFAITFAVQQFMINEIRFQIADWFLFFKLIEHLCYLAIPVVYYFFFIHFFKVERIRYISFSPKKIGNIYALLNMAVGISYIFLMDPVRWDKILTLWFFVHIPFFVFYVGYSMWRAATTLERDAIIVSIGTFVMLLITGHYYMVERGVIAGPSYFSQGVFIFFLTLSFALIFRLIELQMEVEERTRRLDSVNVLRDRVFQYVNIFLRKPSEKVAELSHAVFFNESSGPDRALVRELDNEVEQLQVNIDDILELSRLEVITEPEY
ncbi:MAG: 7TM-DISM domain-containing protein, partial [Leptospiraceae bacterium]|nr:7TM-DISM domain-containing protein [Leptospiraceae bacterium]